MSTIIKFSLMSEEAHPVNETESLIVSMRRRSGRNKTIGGFSDLDLNDGKKEGRRRKTRESDLFQGAELFDRLTRVNSATSLQTLALRPDSPYNKYIEDKARTAKKLFPLKTATEEAFSYMKSFNGEYMAVIDKMRVAQETLRDISHRIKANKACGANALRKCYMPYILLYNHKRDWYEAETERLKHNIDSVARFHEFLMKQDAPCYVDFVAFKKATIKSKPPADEFAKQEARLARLIPKAVRTPPPDTTDPFRNFIHPANRTGPIVQRFIAQIDNCEYPDLDDIASGILETTKQSLTKKEIISMLFEIGWEVKEYPFAPQLTPFSIPDMTQICPKVFNPPYLSDEWSLKTFSELSLSDWPLKSAVAELYAIMMYTDPFEIASAFYHIIEMVGRGVQICLISNDQDASNVDIDFDQLFTLLMICIFTTGLSDITKPMCYSYSFKDDAAEMLTVQQVYAMSHMEGLCTHLAKIDYAGLSRKAKELQAFDDPLGLASAS